MQADADVALERAEQKSSCSWSSLPPVEERTVKEAPGSSARTRRVRERSRIRGGGRDDGTAPVIDKSRRRHKESGLVQNQIHAGRPAQG